MQITYTTTGPNGGTIEHWLQWSTGREIGEISPAWGLWSRGQGPDSVIEGGDWTHLDDAEVVKYDPEDPEDDRLIPPTEVPAEVLAAAARELDAEKVTAYLDGDDDFGGQYWAIEVEG